jgi:hypothetical protein
MTWSYQANSTHNEFYKYSNDQMIMYNAIVDAVNEKVLTEPLIKGVIPCGTMVQNLRTSYIGDNMTKDGFHLTVDKGRYAAGLTWYATLTGNNIDGIDWYPEAFEYIRLDEDVIKEAVNNALTSPYAVTESKFKTYTQPSDEQYIKMLGNGGEYTLLDWKNLGNGYYYSIDGIGLKTNNGTSDNYIASEIFTKEDLPEGSIIILDEGYEYRPEGWKTESSKNTARPEKVSSSAVAVNEKWWGDFTLRGFNLSYKGAKTSVSPEIADHLRIYVPAK